MRLEAQCSMSLFILSKILKRKRESETKKNKVFRVHVLLQIFRVHALSTPVWSPAAGDGTNAVHIVGTGEFFRANIVS